MRKASNFAFAVVCYFDITSTLFARTMQQKIEQVCSADIEKLCAAVKTDADQLKGCMMTKRTQVSSACIKLFDASE